MSTTAILMAVDASIASCGRRAAGGRGHDESGRQTTYNNGEGRGPPYTQQSNNYMRDKYNDDEDDKDKDEDDRGEER